MDSPGYNVVFLYTKKAGAYEGVMTWTSFPSREDFEKNKNRFLDDGRQVVLRAGVSREEAISLCLQTPMDARLRVARHEATDPSTWDLNVEIYLSRLCAINTIGALGK